MDVPESLTMRGRYTSALADGIDARVAMAPKTTTRMSGVADEEEEEDEGLRALTREEAPIVIAIWLFLVFFGLVFLLFGLSRFVVAPTHTKQSKHAF